MAYSSTIKKLLLIFAVGATLAACQSSLLQKPLVNLDKELQQCFDLSLEFEQQVDTDGVNNAAVTAISSLPFLATNRFHSALASDAKTSRQVDAWVQMSVDLGVEFRRWENTNLATPWPDTQLAQLNSCSQMFASLDRYYPLRETLASEHLSPKDNYSSLPQWLGLYPLLRPIFKSRINKLHREEKRWFTETENFDTPLVYGLVDQTTAAPYGLEEWFEQSYHTSELGLPKLDDSQLAMLFELHAPQFEINTQTDGDKLGMPAFADSDPAIDISKAVTYTLPSYTRFDGRNLLQLNYVVWFPQRGPVRPLDLFAGKIDSLIWRVTLDEKGKALLYDSVHSCGCYHKVFLANEKLKPRLRPLSEEPANIIAITQLDTRQGLRLVVTSNEHFVVGIEPRQPIADFNYTMADYSALYSLPRSTGRASWFGPTGIIKGSERLERFTLWPTGIESVGAMRQWGTHAIGFVDRQHFDDPSLFDNYLISD